MANRIRYVMENSMFYKVFSIERDHYYSDYEEFHVCYYVDKQLANKDLENRIATGWETKMYELPITTSLKENRKVKRSMKCYHKDELIKQLLRCPGSMEILLNAGWIDDLNVDYTYNDEQGISEEEFQNVVYLLLKNVPSFFKVE